ncbi:lipoxygenase [Nostoc sp. B(2019)]|nr:lipoxygenase [Nostoc sp. B(2019)]
MNIIKPLLPQIDQETRQFLPDRDQYKFDHDILAPLATLHPVIPAFSVPPGYPRVPQSSTLSPTYVFTRSSLPNTLDPFDGLQAFDDFFPTQGKPEVSKIYQSDRSFADQRLSGVNPMVLRRIMQIPPHCSVTKEELKAACPNVRLDTALANGNIYVADYSSLSFVQGGTFKGMKKYLPTPIAFFYFDETKKELIPIAIQVQPKRGGAIFTPHDKPLDWLVAKMCVQVADANHHEMSSHLCWTHFVMEPFAISTPRQLAINHPVHLLLAPHLRFLLAINDQGRQLLINPYVDGQVGGHVDRIMAGTLEESYGIVKKAYSEWSLDKFAFPQEIKSRGLEDVKKLPNFPYRDDGMLLWNAINKFVSDYLKYCYPTPADIQGDKELQAWAKELTSADGGRVKGMPSAIATVEQLIEIVTNVIFTCGPQHAAVNYSQFDYMAYIPNMPQAAYIGITGKGMIPDEKALMKFLPPKDQAEAQIKIVSYLSFYRHDRLGYYDEVFNLTFRGTPVKMMVQEFQQELNEIEQRIDAMNRQRFVPYPYLKPSLVPNSFSA